MPTATPRLSLRGGCACACSGVAGVGVAMLPDRFGGVKHGSARAVDVVVMTTDPQTQQYLYARASTQLNGIRIDFIGTGP